MHHRTLYVIHENIEITHPGEPAVYSILTDAPVYKMEIDYSARSDYCHIGYCRLKSCEILRKTTNPIEVYLSADDNSVGTPAATDDDDEDTASLFRSKHRDSILMHSRTSRKTNYGTIYANTEATQSASSLVNSSPPSSEYDYVYMTSVSNHQPLSIMRNIAANAELSSTSLPDICITTSVTTSSASEDDQSQSAYETTKHYFNSKSFLAYFLHIFQDTLADTLGIAKSELTQATWMGASIFSRHAWEVIPAIACPWPKEAFEWIHRHREIRENPITKQKFQWPTRTMVNKVTSFGCHVVPIGSPKTAFDAKRELEWKIVFPEAERYLESCLTSTQIKVLLIAKALVKTFVEPYFDGKTNQLTMEHLRSHLFWQCEHNCAAWPEDYLGEALIRYLRTLLEHLKRQKLPDYFLPRRNLFENVSAEVLVELHRRIFRITENPVMHLLIALRNLKFFPGLFPCINYKKIYSAIIIDNPLKIVNPMFRTKDDAIEEHDEGGADDDDDIWDIPQPHDGRLTGKKKKRVKFAAPSNEHDKPGQKTQRRFSAESIDIKTSVTNHMEQIRRVILYETFILHFIEMAKTFLKYKTWNQSLIYLKQASRLCDLLAEDEGKSEADVFRTKINSIHKNVMSERNRDAPGLYKPKLPVRQNSMESLLKLQLTIGNKSPLLPQRSAKDTIHEVVQFHRESHDSPIPTPTATTFKCVDFFNEIDDADDAVPAISAKSHRIGSTIDNESDGDTEL